MPAGPSPRSAVASSPAGRREHRSCPPKASAPGRTRAEGRRSSVRGAFRSGLHPTAAAAGWVPSLRPGLRSVRLFPPRVLSLGPCTVPVPSRHLLLTLGALLRPPPRGLPAKGDSATVLSGPLVSPCPYGAGRQEREARTALALVPPDPRSGPRKPAGRSNELDMDAA